MESIMLNVYIGEHVMINLPLIEKLRLRLVNEPFKAAMEQWLARYQRRFQLRETQLQVLTIVSLLPARLDLFVIDSELNELMWFNDRRPRDPSFKLIKERRLRVERHQGPSRTVSTRLTSLNSQLAYPNLISKFGSPRFVSPSSNASLSCFYTCYSASKQCVHQIFRELSLMPNQWQHGGLIIS